MSAEDFEWQFTKCRAAKLWELLPKNDNDNFETVDHPMHPNLFFQLSSVQGFNKMNGYSYDEYVQLWHKRRLN